MLEELQSKLIEVEKKLDRLLAKGGNDEKLVDKKREIQQEIWRELKQCSK